MLAALTFLAQNTQEAPDEGLGIGMLLLGVLIAVLVFSGIFFAFTKATKRSKGGVQAAPESQAPGAPPLEGVHRDR